MVITAQSTLWTVPEFNNIPTGSSPGMSQRTRPVIPDGALESQGAPTPVAHVTITPISLVPISKGRRGFLKSATPVHSYQDKQGEGGVEKLTSNNHQTPRLRHTPRRRRSERVLARQGRDQRRNWWFPWPGMRLLASHDWTGRALGTVC
jgi:hypothetical protein